MYSDFIFLCSDAFKDSDEFTNLKNYIIIFLN